MRLSSIVQPAGEQAVALVNDELHRIAARELRGERPDHLLQTTALIHEAYARLVGSEALEIQSRGHFFAIASQQMRRILVDYALSQINRHSKASCCLKHLARSAIIAARVKNMNSRTLLLAIAGLLLAGWIPDRAHRVLGKAMEICIMSSIMMRGRAPIGATTKQPSVTSPRFAKTSTGATWIAAGWRQPSAKSSISRTSTRSTAAPGSV
jgi:hypothetical protein